MTKTLEIYDQKTAEIRAFEKEVKDLGGYVTDCGYPKDNSTLQINAWIPDQPELELKP